MFPLQKEKKRVEKVEAEAAGETMVVTKGGRTTTTALSLGKPKRLFKRTC